MAKNNIVVSMLLNNTDFVKKMGWSVRETRNFENKVNKATGSLKQMAMGGLAPMLGKMTAFAGGAALVGGALSRATEKMMALDTAMSEMRALLGATEAQMEGFKSAALNMASSTTVAADEIIRAMIKVGSAMPQLLGFEEGLKSVTKSAVTLSEASGMSLDESINSLTGMMNQFSASAIDSDRYINALAAASQAGSAEIDYLSMAIAKAGGAATSADIEFEELVALIEAIAPKFGKAEEAGTALRGVLLKMETGEARTKISTQGLAKALDNLAKMGTQEMLKKFGVEGYNMAKAMVDARGAFEKFNSEVRGTNAAEEQAEIRTNNLRGAIDKLVNRWDSFTLSVNNSNGPLTKFVRLLDRSLELMTTMFPTYNSWVNQQKDLWNDKAKTDVAAELQAMEAGGMSREDAIKKLQERNNALLQANRAKKSQLDAKYGSLEERYGAPTPESSNFIVDFLSYSSPFGLWGSLFSNKKEVSDQIEDASKSPQHTVNMQIVEGEAIAKYLADALSSLKSSDDEGVTPGGGSAGGGGDKNPIGLILSDLKSMGLNSDQLLDLEKSVHTAEELRKQLSEVETLINSNQNNTELVKRLNLLRDLYKTQLGEFEKPAEAKATVIGGLDVTDLEERRNKIIELESEISRLKEYLEQNPSRVDILFTLARLTGELYRLKPAANAAKEALKSTYTNPWEQNYRDNYKNGNAHQRIGFASDAAGTVANGVNSVGSLIGEIPGLEEIGEGISTVTSVIMDVIGVIQAVSAIMELIEGVNAVKEMTVTTANTAALAANTTALGILESTIAANTFSHFIPGCSEGGVIGGSSWTGDKLLARVNSGELVLNAKQQKNLLAGLNNVGGVETVGGSSKTLIRGEDLWVAIDNFQRRTKRRL